jgi:hypothetical protein
MELAILFFLKIYLPIFSFDILVEGRIQLDA